MGAACQFGDRPMGGVVWEIRGALRTPVTVVTLLVFSVF